MAATAKSLAKIETVNDAKPAAAAKDIKNLKATSKNYSAQEETQRRKWGVETVAVRSVHARKF